MVSTCPPAFTYYVTRGAKVSSRSLPTTITTTETMNQCDLDYWMIRFLSSLKRLGPKNLTKQDFKILKPLAKGYYGKVYVVESLVDRHIYCMKVQNKALLSKPESIDRISVEQEHRILKEQHPLLPRLYAYFEDTEHHYLVMEFLAGGDLFSLLDRQPDFCLTEDHARFYMAEMVLACQALHHMGYLHRDIKPQNILLDNQGHIRLADFGTSLALSTKDWPTVPVGTCDYIAPEVLLSVQGGSYGTEVDCWSLGICLYEMLQAIPPFYCDSSENETFRRIVAYQGSLDFDPVLPISDHAKDLIHRLLADRSERMDLDQIKTHPFFSGIDWNLVTESTPPFVPALTSLDDTSNFSVPESELPATLSWSDSDASDTDSLSPPLSPI